MKFVSLIFLPFFLSHGAWSLSSFSSDEYSALTGCCPGEISALDSGSASASVLDDGFFLITRHIKENKTIKELKTLAYSYKFIWGGFLGEIVGACTGKKNTVFPPSSDSL